MVDRCDAQYKNSSLDLQVLYYHQIIGSITGRLAKECSFVKFPQKPEDFTSDNGIIFETGKFQGQNIDKLVIFPGGIVLDTREDTGVSEATLTKLLEWGAVELGLEYRPEMLKRRVFVESLVVRSEVPLLEINPVQRLIASRVSDEMENCLGRPLIYDVTGLQIGYDKMTTTFTPSAFTLERREGLPFSDNVYFSNAPLRTEIHLQLLEEIEKAAIAVRG